MSKNILIGITSSIASYKIYDLIRKFKKTDYNVKVILTPNALEFVSPIVIETLSKNEVYVEQYCKRSNPEHICLCDWADCFLIAPISANTISKITAGICDNLLTSVACAYLGSQKPLIIAPAMNEGMYLNPFVKENIEKLKNNNVSIIDPQKGYLACGAEGIGRLADIDIIYQKTLREIHQNKKNNSKKILVTSGGTIEAIDNVRYITNFSSGKMGYNLALSAYYNGFDVKLITTCDTQNPPFITQQVKSALEMLNAIQNSEFDYLFMASAVCDYRSNTVSAKKLKKEELGKKLTLNLTQNPDVVATIAKSKTKNQIITGFCLADDDLINCAKNKLKNKNLDYIIANDVQTALNKDENEVTIISKSGKMVNIKKDTKFNIAKKILEVVCD